MIDSLRFGCDEPLGLSVRRRLIALPSRTPQFRQSHSEHRPASCYSSQVRFATSISAAPVIPISSRCLASPLFRDQLFEGGTHAHQCDDSLRQNNAAHQFLLDASDEPRERKCACRPHHEEVGLDSAVTCHGHIYQNDHASPSHVSITSPQATRMVSNALVWASQNCAHLSDIHDTQ